ncbi:non-ribosomal peptide synthetase [Solihabitans fulvus]|nr:non-ribosomal peptide synthetase [Solihabitans fulvus]
MAPVASELRSRLLGEFNGRRVFYPQDRTVLQLFEDRARRQPDAPAVTFGDRTLTYGRLNRLANTLAGRLREAGVGRGDLVPLLLRNGFELPLSMLAAMKLAAPFVPFDDLWPGDRLDRMIETLRPTVLVCSPATEPRPGWPATLSVDVDDLAERDSDDHGSPAGMDDLIYGFYTSGSTGLPKCTLNIHRGLLNRFGYMTRAFSDRTDEVVLQNSRPAFDSSLWQLLWPLTTGSQVVIPDRAGILDLAATTALIKRHGVTMTDFVPSIFNTLVEMLDATPELAGELRSLRRLLIGGEEINTGAVQRFRRLLPQVRITNTYGPTEASIGSVFHEVTDADAESIPIGRPIDNTYAVVLDENRELVPPGVHGEIHIGGDCLGLGYLNDPDKTAAAFVPNPFDEIPGPQLYRTGDIGYVRPDGLLGFVGRRDNQVKVGGVRVELSEIESALLSHPQVLDAKVVLSGTDGAARLVAFLTHRDDPDVAALRRHARDALPPYLVPKQFVLLDAMPLTPTGKTDRRRLAKLADRSAEAEDTEQSGDVRQVIHTIWRRLLAEPIPHTSADFFEHGGDSLSAQRLALALSDHFGVRITVRDVVTVPTIEQQAQLVAGAPVAAVRARTPEEPSADVLLPEDITGDRPLASSTVDDVLLTGATGFVGAQLVSDLLAGTDATVHCVVRAADAAEAERRLATTLRAYRLWDDAVADRIVAVPGDLRAVRLGLSGDTYGELTERVGAVVHNGALVNLLLGYGAHRLANVTGTLNVLRLAAEARTKPVHFVSTLGVVVADGRAGRFPEGPVPADTAPADGYSQSKWVAERLLQTAAERGIPVAVYRLGEVMPHSATGVPNPRSLVELLVHACLSVGAVFSSGSVTDYTPVDRVGRLVVAGLASAATGHFHVLAPRPVALDDVLGAFATRFDLRRLDYTEFWHVLRGVAADRPDDAPLRSALAVIPPADGPDVAARVAELFQGTAAQFETDRADALARRAGLPPLDRADAALSRYADHHAARDQRWAPAGAPVGR